MMKCIEHQCVKQTLQQLFNHKVWLIQPIIMFKFVNKKKIKIIFFSLSVKIKEN